MRNTIFLGLFLIFISFSCDKVTDPIVKKNVVVGENFITKSNANVSHFKKVLLEDYTGHTCGYCPPAAEVAHEMATKYQDTIVIIAVHAGSFSEVKLPDYPNSFTTTASVDWDKYFIGLQGNPNGMVNRKVFGTGTNPVQKESKWPSSIALDKKEPMVVKLDVTTKYDTTLRSLSAEVRAKFLSSYQNETKLSVVLTEDEIIGPQKDYRKTPNKVPDFKFEHMLRGSLNGSWGDVLKSGPIATNDSALTSYPNLGLDSAFNDKHVYVVVFAYDAVTRKVLQAEKVKIR